MPCTAWRALPPSSSVRCTHLPAVVSAAILAPATAPSSNCTFTIQGPDLLLCMRALASGARVRLGVSRSEAVNSSTTGSTGSLATARRLHTAFTAAGSPCGSGNRSMGQKSIDSFFKRPASSAKAATDPAGAGADPAAGASAAPAAGADPQAPAASAQAPGGDGADTTASEQPAAPDTAEAQLSERQLLRAQANRNAALAKQVREPVGRAAPSSGCAGRRAPRLAWQNCQTLRHCPWRAPPHPAPSCWQGRSGLPPPRRHQGQRAVVRKHALHMAPPPSLPPTRWCCAPRRRAGCRG